MKNMFLGYIHFFNVSLEIDVSMSASEDFRLFLIVLVFLWRIIFVVRKYFVNLQYVYERKKTFYRHKRIG